MIASQQVALFLLLGVAASYAYPSSYGRFLRKQDTQGRLGGELGGEGGGADAGGSGGKKGKEAVSVQQAVEEDNHKPSYKFEYTVNDPHTGDHKKQWEHREGGVVKGLYSLVEPDGSLRTVHYEADPKTGFHATVHKTGVNKHPAPSAYKKAAEPVAAPAVKDFYSRGGFGGGEEDFRL